MKNALLLHTNPTLKFIRQTPGGLGSWGEWYFHENIFSGDFDAVVVYNNFNKKIKIKVPEGNKILITAEPQSIIKYDQAFCDQFDVIISTQTDIKHKDLRVSHTALPWHVGIKRENSIAHKFISDGMLYDDFNRRLIIDKKRILSLMTSSKLLTKGHRERFSFSKIMQEEFGSQVDVYGAGVNFCDDKIDALSKYQYHIAIENCSIPYYWTEKLADAFLTETYPIYYGCTNIFKYFPRNSLLQIDITKPQLAIKSIRKAINENYHIKFAQEMAIAKDYVLNKYNLFPFAVRHLDACCKNNRIMKSTRLKPMVRDRKGVMRGFLKKLHGYIAFDR